MRYSAALCLALASGWATEHEAFRPLDFRVLNHLSTQSRHPRARVPRSQSPTYPNYFSTQNGDWTFLTSRSTRLFSDPHPPDQPPSERILSLEETSSNTGGSIKAFFAKKAETVNAPNSAAVDGEIDDNVAESTTLNELDAPEVKNDENISPLPTVESTLEGDDEKAQQEEEAADVVGLVEIYQQVEAVDVIEAPQEEEEPAKPFMTPEQQEELKLATARFVKEVLVSRLVLLLFFS